RDLFNKLKRSKNRLEDSSVESPLNQYEAAPESENTKEIAFETQDLEDKTSELNIENVNEFKEKKPRPEFLTFPFWKSHFDVAVARIKHTRLKSMKVPKNEKELAEDREKKTFSLANL